jgi:protoporphyrinogen/coproporphyrinogen III oxidase
VNIRISHLLIALNFLQVVDYLIDPFVAGTSAGDPESLSVSYYAPSFAFIDLGHKLLCIFAVM